MTLEELGDILKGLTESLEQHKSQITMLIVKNIKDRTDRDRAISLSNRIFDLNHRTTKPDEYLSDQKELNEILKKHGADHTIA